MYKPNSLHILITILLFSSLLLSCKRGEKEGIDGVEVINVEVSDRLYLSQITDSVCLIPLETDLNHIIGTVKRVISWKDKFFILSGSGYDPQNNVLYSYSKDGKFLAQIGKRGQGNGEYFDLRDFAIRDSLVYLLGAEYILKYDVNGNYINRYKYHSQTKLINNLGENIIISVSPYEQNFLLEKTDTLFAHKEYILPVSPIEKELNRIYERGITLDTDGTTAYFCPSFSRDIYAVQSESPIQPIYHINYEKKNINFNKLDSVEVSNRKVVFDYVDHYPGGYMSICDILNLPDYFIFTSTDEQHNGFLTIYDKKKKEQITSSRIVDDVFYQGNTLNMKPGSMAVYRDGDYILFLVEPSYLLKGHTAFKKGMKKEVWEEFCRQNKALVQICEGLNEDSNPVFAKIKIK